MVRSSLLLLFCIICHACNPAAQGGDPSGAPANIKMVSDMFDWSKAEALKRETLSELDGNTPEDQVFSQFVKRYENLMVELNDKLRASAKYENFNTLAHKGEPHPDALALAKEAENNGFDILSEEGMIYIEGTCSYMKIGIVDKLDAGTKRYLNLYCKEMEQRCCSDARIIISVREVVKRGADWGELVGKSKGKSFAGEAEATYKKYLWLFLEGLDNSPAFNFATQQFDRRRLGLLDEYIAERPGSRMAKDLEAFRTELENADLELTEDLKKYLTELTN